MEFLTKNFKTILIIALIGYVYFNNQKIQRLNTDLIGKTDAYQQLTDEIAALEIKYVNQTDLLQATEAKFKSEAGALKGEIKLLSNATYLIREHARKSNNSDLVYQGTRAKYVVNEIRYNNGPAVGYVLIFDDGRVVSKLYRSEINVDTAVSVDDITGKYVVLNKADYILKSPSINFNGEKNWYNKPFPLKITSGTALVDPTEAAEKSRVYKWLPKYNLGLSINEHVSYGAAVSLAGIGTTQNDLKWKFLSLGLQYNKVDKVEFTLTPVLYRAFKALPNTYLGPTIEFGQNGMQFGLGLQLGL